MKQEVRSNVLSDCSFSAQTGIRLRVSPAPKRIELQLSRRLRLGVRLFLPAFMLVLVSVTMADDNIRLACTPRAFQVVPGEPIRLELIVHTDSALPFRWIVPNDQLLKLRAIEELPVRRTREGVVVYERVVVWQGLEPGKVKIKTLSVETKRQKLRFPEVSITIRDLTP